MTQLKECCPELLTKVAVKLISCLRFGGLGDTVIFVTHKSIGQVAAPAGKVLELDDGALGADEGALVFDDGAAGVDDGAPLFADGGLLPAVGTDVGEDDVTVLATTCPRNRIVVPRSFQYTLSPAAANNSAVELASMVCASVKRPLITLPRIRKLVPRSFQYT